ncbi:FecR domain-containing protein [uncultured Bradyrhizobium sp.]|uniref:FecR family protein n=1 Tax=uncultured Bradyrhizobium sp. TaxID=199684 RepID=UPI002622D47F|nr:FecR domain-containing protein [uncultured Bradyrhizobium sp.]
MKSGVAAAILSLLLISLQRNFRGYLSDVMLKRIATTGSLILCVAQGGATAALSASADQIGLAVTIKNNVSQLEPNASKITQGDDVFRNEVVQTLDDSSAKFVLKDSTNLILGPSSKLKLDRAVFSDETTVGDIAIRLTTGAFRFITGHSAKEAYVISTPIATMGVRGTTLDFLIEPFQNTVVLKDGQSQVCAGGKCVQLTKVGDTAIVKAYGAQINVEVQPSSTWSFDSACNGMCSPMSFAQAENSLTTGSIGAGAGGGGGTSGGGGPTGLSGITSGSNAGLNQNISPGTSNGASPSLTTSFGAATFSEVSPH